MIPILFQDEHIVVIDKPSGLLVHRSMIDKHETRFALQMVRDQIGQYVYPVHRLDKPTSGVLVMALSPEVASMLAELFVNKQITKQYIALVRGHTKQSERIDYPLKEVLDKKSDKKARVDKDPQEAVTNYQKLLECEVPISVGRYSTARYSLLSLNPETGRKHQLRRHMKHVFHPIVGDTTHGDGKHNQMFRERFDLDRLMLVAKEIKFIHPITKETLSIKASLGEKYLNTLASLGWPNDEKYYNSLLKSIEL